MVLNLKLWKTTEERIEPNLPPISSDCTFLPTDLRKTFLNNSKSKITEIWIPPTPLPFSHTPSLKMTTKCLNFHLHGHYIVFQQSAFISDNNSFQSEKDIFSLSWHFSVLLKNVQTPHVNQPSCNSTYLVLISSKTCLNNTSRKGFWFKMKRSECPVFEIRLLTTPAR